MSKEKDISVFATISQSMPGNFEIDDNDRNHLEDDVRKMLKDNVRALSMIQPLIKKGTSETFRNSSGSLYEFLVDNEICIHCPSKLSKCPKKRVGYLLHPVYDKDRDEIKNELRECQYQQEKEKALSLIEPCYNSKEAIYKAMDKTLSFLREPGNSSKMMDTTKLITEVAKTALSFDKEKKYKGYHIRSINSQTLDRDVMMAITYIYTKGNIRVGYINCYKFFAGLVDKDWIVQDEAKRVYQKMIHVPVLMLENLNNIPQVNDEILMTYLYGLLQERVKAGKITYCTTSTSIGAKNLIYSKLRNLACGNEASKLADMIFEERAIKDFDVRP